MKRFIENSNPAIRVTLVIFLLCGLVYPAAMTGVAQVFFNHEANGSLLEVDGKVVGSEKLGQAFTSPEYFRGRVSSINYNIYTEADLSPNKDGEPNYSGVGSGTFNYAPSNPELEKRIEADIETFLAENPTVEKSDIPADLMTASGSGQDPHISVASALIQIDRIAEASGISSENLAGIIEANTERRLAGLFGEDVVNVLTANLAISREMKTQNTF